MKCCENECTPQGTHIYREMVTSRYKKYCSSIPVGLRGTGDGLETEYIHSQKTSMLNIDINLEPIRNEPRLQALLKKMNFT